MAGFYLVPQGTAWCIMYDLHVSHKLLFPVDGHYVILEELV